MLVRQLLQYQNIVPMAFKEKGNITIYFYGQSKILKTLSLAKLVFYLKNAISVCVLLKIKTTCTSLGMV